MARHAPSPHSTEDLSWRDGLASLRYVRPLLRLVWETSPPLVLAAVVLRLIRALIPLAMLWVSKLILDAVVAWITHGAGAVAHIWNLVALEFALAGVCDLLGRANSLFDTLPRRTFPQRRRLPPM